jgi:hypothetical protein
MKKILMIKKYLFTIRWLWKNRHWNNTRQKFKAMDRDWERMCKR